MFRMDNNFGGNIDQQPTNNGEGFMHNPTENNELHDLSSLLVCYKLLCFDIYRCIVFVFYYLFNFKSKILFSYFHIYIDFYCIE